MPVFLVNADPAYPFTQIVRQYGLDLYEDWRPLPAVANYCGLHDVAAEAERRPLWGYWPRTLNSNKALLRSHLDEILQVAEAGATIGSPRSGNYVWLALASALWLKEQGQQQQALQREPQAQQQPQQLQQQGQQQLQHGDNGPLDRGMLEYLRIGMAPRNVAAETRPMGAKLALIQNLIRVIAIPTEVDPDADEQAWALALVEARLVDSVVFLVHNPVLFQERDRLTFAALRLVGAALDNAEVYQRFRPDDVDQAGSSTARVYIDHAFLRPTESDRRVAFLRRVLFKANEAAGEPQATGALAAQARRLRNAIEQDMDLPGRQSAEPQRTRARRAAARLHDDVPRNPCKNPETAPAFLPRWVAVPVAAETIARSTLEYKESLSAHLRDVQDHWFHSSRSTALEWSRDDRTMMGDIKVLSSGTSGTRESDLADLQEVRREVRRTVADTARQQRAAREILRPPADPAVEEKDALFRPLSIKSPDGSGREIPTTRPTTAYGKAAHRVLEAERGRFAARSAVPIIVLFGITLTISTILAVIAAPGTWWMQDILRALSLDPTTGVGMLMLVSLFLLAVGLVTSFRRRVSRLLPVALAGAFALTFAATAWLFYDAIEKGGTFAEALRAIGWHPLAPFVLLLEFGFIAALGAGAASARRRFTRACVAYERAAENLETEAFGRLAHAKTYGANHFATGWLRALDVRIDELEAELSRTDAAQRLQAEIAGWAGSQALVELSKEDEERATSLAQDLVGTTRARWVLRAARALPPAIGGKLNVGFTGQPQPIAISAALFLDAAPILWFDVRKT